MLNCLPGRRLPEAHLEPLQPKVLLELDSLPNRPKVLEAIQARQQPMELQQAASLKQTVQALLLHQTNHSPERPREIDGTGTKELARPGTLGLAVGGTVSQAGGTATGTEGSILGRPTRQESHLARSLDKAQL